MRLRFDVHGEGLVPVFGGGSVDVGERGEACVTCVGDDDIEAVESSDGCGYYVVAV